MTRAQSAWWRLNGWRRSRPFWGGLLLVLAGVEVFATTQMSLDGLSFQLGPTGFLSWLVPTILVACGLLAWFTPQQRLFYAVVGAVTAVFSLIGVNLGGFLLGVLLGVVGAGLVFAWVPVPAPPPTFLESGDADGAEPPLSRNEGEGEPGPEPAARPLPRREAPPLYSIALLLALTVTATVLVAVRPAGPAQAAPTPCPTTTGRSGPRTTAKPPGKLGAAATPTPSPSRSRGPIGQIIDGIVDLFDGDDEEPPAATPTPARPGAEPSPSKTKPTRPAACPTPTATGSPIPTIAADPGQPRVNAVPSRLTGTKVTMNDLKIAGIVDLPTANGTIKAIKFTMSRSTVDDFVLTIPQGEGRRPLVIESSALTVRGDVSFYASRFVGWILGIKLTLTASSPLLPEGGIPLSLPVISFDRPEMQLVYVDCDVLTAPDLDESFPDAG